LYNDSRQSCHGCTAISRTISRRYLRMVSLDLAARHALLGDRVVPAPRRSLLEGQPVNGSGMEQMHRHLTGCTPANTRLFGIGLTSRRVRPVPGSSTRTPGFRDGRQVLPGFAALVTCPASTSAARGPPRCSRPGTAPNRRRAIVPPEKGVAPLHVLGLLILEQFRIGKIALACLGLARSLSGKKPHRLGIPRSPATLMFWAVRSAERAVSFYSELTFGAFKL
jgi:hypothetical protein